MGVDTKGFVLSRCKDVLLIGTVVHNAINHLVLDEKRVRYPTRIEVCSKEARDAFQTCKMTLDPGIGMLTVDFTFCNARRSLKLFFTCDCDHAEYGPKSVSVTLGCFGHSELFIKSALHALSLFGPAYFDANDCDDVDNAPLGENPLTVLAAVKLGYIRMSDVATWLEAWDASQFNDGRTFKEFFGTTETVIRELVGREDYQSSWDDIKALAEKTNAMPVFMEDFHQEALASE